MKSLHKKLTLLLLVLCLLGYGAPIGRYDEASKHWEVDTGALSCTFFYGCMYPVWFKNPAGEAFPFFIFADTLRHDGKTAYLYEERWAEFRIIENTAERFAIECKGNFCYGQAPYNVPDEKVTATYTYELTRGKSDIGLTIRLTKPAGTAVDTDLCALRWRYLPFDNYGDITLSTIPYLECRRAASASLRHASMALRLGDHQVILLREPYGNTFFYMKDADGVRHWAAESTELTLSTRLCFEKK